MVGDVEEPLTGPARLGTRGGDRHANAHDHRRHPESKEDALPQFGDLEDVGKGRDHCYLSWLGCPKLQMIAGHWGIQQIEPPGDLAVGADREDLVERSEIGYPRAACELSLATALDYVNLDDDS